MPSLHLDPLDDPIAIDSCAGFLGGQHSYGPPDQLTAVQAASLVNIDIRDGPATTRRGTEALGDALPGAITGLAWYDTPAFAGLMAASAGALYRWDESTWTLCPGWTSTAPGRPVAFAQLGDKLYLADGLSHLMRWDGAAFTDLGTGSAAQPPVGSLLLSAQNRLWLAGLPALPDALCASALLDGATWDSTNLVLRLGAGEGDPITGLAEWDDYQIVVFKRSSIYVVRADPATTGGGTSAPLTKASVTKISATIGCVSHRSIARVGGDLWFLSDSGVFSLGRASAQLQLEVKPALSLAVQDVIARITPEAASQAAALYWNHRYLLALPLDGETEPAAVLVCNTQRACWSGLWTGWSPQAWALARPGGAERLVLGRPDGQVWRWLDYVPEASEVESTFRDASAEIASAVITRGLTFRESVCPKSALHAEAEFFHSRALATLALSLDEEPPIPLGSDFPTDPGDLRLTVTLPARLATSGLHRRAFSAQHLPPFRTLQLHVTSSAGKLALRGATASAFVNTLKLEA